MQTIKKEYHIMAPLSKVWEALTSSKVIDKWGGGPSKMSAKVGKFSLWGGDIHGQNIEVISTKKLVQDWYAGDWPKPSRVEFKLTHKDGCTALYLTHTQVPDSEAKEIDKGWDDYYLGRIKDLLE